MDTSNTGMDTHMEWLATQLPTLSGLSEFEQSYCPPNPSTPPVKVMMIPALQSQEANPWILHNHRTNTLFQDVFAGACFAAQTQFKKRRWLERIATLIKDERTFKSMTEFSLSRTGRAWSVSRDPMPAVSCKRETDPSRSIYLGSSRVFE
jgi:hypothetical protein